MKTGIQVGPDGAHVSDLGNRVLIETSGNGSLSPAHAEEFARAIRKAAKRAREREILQTLRAAE